VCLFLRCGEFEFFRYNLLKSTNHTSLIAQNGRIAFYSNSKVSDNHHGQLLDLASCKVWPFVGDSRSCFWFDLSDNLQNTLLFGK
jgi:hypothetical protein